MPSAREVRFSDGHSNRRGGLALSSEALEACGITPLAPLGAVSATPSPREDTSNGFVVGRMNTLSSYGYGVGTSMLFSDTDDVDTGEGDYDDGQDGEDFDYDNYVNSREENQSSYQKAIDAFEKLGMLNNPLQRYSRDEFVAMRNAYDKDISHRRNWIFDRIEREGFERRRLGKFSLEDLLERIEKKSHNLSNEVSKFYDWTLGGTEYIIRLEYIKQNNCDLLVCHYIYTPTQKTYRQDLRFWNGQRFEVAEEFSSSYS
jgi:hypothetical protein